VAAYITSSKATDTGKNRKSEDIDQLWQIEDCIAVKFREATLIYYI
jgi:hypothetical protein